MDAAHWQYVKNVFREAVDLPPEQQESYLIRVCDGDENLREQVAAMLRAEEESLFLDHPIQESIFDVNPVETLVPGRKLGVYTIIEKLGEGGMGAVYLADRNDGAFAKKVAIKLLKRGLDTDEMLRRFQTERRILAGFEHPNIARLYDAGATPEGLPYYVMEYIEGEPIHRWCDKRRLTIAQRLNVFARVCDAVGYLHRNLVVHRDIKPANILVTPDGQPKLLDFGIAKLLEAEDQHTRTGPGPMTPEYASPEQLRGESITTASDVYALGLLLYLLLTGRKPRVRRGSEQGHIGVGNRPRPVTDLQETDGEDVQKWAHNRGLDRRGLIRALQGDPDTLIWAALREEPERRYGSAYELREDVMRYLDGFPLAARPDTLGYRTTRFVGRHRWLLSTAAIALVALLTFTGLLADQVHETRRQVQIAQQERDTASRVVGLLAVIFEDPYSVNGAGELLARAVELIDQELEPDSVVRATMLDTIGHAYTQLGLYDRARITLEEGYRLRADLVGADHVDMVQPLVRMGHLHMEEGRYDEAEDLFKQARGYLAHEGEHPAAADIHRHLGVLYRHVSRFDAAERELLTAIELHRQQNEITEAAECKNVLALIYAALGRMDEAETLHLQALDASREKYGEHHPRTARAYRSLGDLAINRGLGKEANHWLELALERHEQALGARHPDTAVTLHYLAQARGMLGRYQEVKTMMERVLSIRLEVLGSDHPKTVVTLGDMGILYNKLGQYAKAEEYLARAIEGKERIYGPDSYEVAHSLNNIARSRRSQGKFDGVEDLYHRTLGIYERTVGTQAGYFVASLGNLANYYRQVNRFDQATDLDRQILALREEKDQTFTPIMARNMLNLSQSLMMEGYLDQAELLLVRALAFWDSRPDSCHTSTALVLATLGAVHSHQGRYREAEPLLREALVIREQLLGRDHPLVAETLNDLAELLRNTNRNREAMSLAMRARTIQQVKTLTGIKH